MPVLELTGHDSVTAVMTAMKHACFLRDPRTDIVVGEPRYDLPIVPRLKLFLPQELNRVGVSPTTLDYCLVS